MADSDPIEGAYATLEDLKAIWPGLPTDQESRARALLQDAAVRIDAYAPLTSVESAEVARDIAIRRTVSREMVMFLMASDVTPGVPMETQRSMGPFSQSFDPPKSGRTLLLTTEHKAMLRTRHQVAFSVAMAPLQVDEPPEWWSL